MTFKKEREGKSRVSIITTKQHEFTSPSTYLTQDNGLCRKSLLLHLEHISGQTTERD